MKKRHPSELPRRGATAAALIVAACLAGCGRAGRDVDGAIMVSGNIEVTDARLAFKIPGRLIERTVDEGDQVQTGQLVARLDAIELEQQLAVRRAEHAGALAQLAELEAGSRPQEIAAAEATLRSAQAERVRSALEFARQRDLRTTDAVSERELESARAVLQVAEARENAAAEQLALVREGPRRERIDQARAGVAQAVAAVALATTQVTNARLEAPFAGVVLEKHAEPGEFVAAGAPIVTIADTAHVWVRAYVNQTDLGRLRLGQPVEVRTDTFPDKVYDGRLTFISSEAEFTPKTVQTAKERVKLVFRVKVEIENAAGELKPGMAADAVMR
jgi:HlyD family secretion protein